MDYYRYPTRRYADDVTSVTSDDLMMLTIAIAIAVVGALIGATLHGCVSSTESAPVCQNEVALVFKGHTVHRCDPGTTLEATFDADVAHVVCRCPAKAAKPASSTRPSAPTIESLLFPGEKP